MGMLPEQFYKQRILTCPKRREVELPWPRDYEAIRVEKSLFDWRLYHWKKRYLSCASEWEARYLKVWLEHGLMRIEIPNDPKVLQQVTVELEALAEKISKIAEKKLVGYRESTQREVLHGVWQWEDETCCTQTTR